MEPPSRWDTFIEWAKRFHEWPQFNKQERDYKLKIAENLKAAKDALLGDVPDWGEKLKRAFGSPNNLTSWRSHAPFLELIESNPEELREALRQLWKADVTLHERVRGFADRVREIGVQQGLDKEHRQTFGNWRATLASFLLMADDVTQYPMYGAALYKAAYRLSGIRLLKGTRIFGNCTNARSISSTNSSHGRLLAGLRIQDRLDAQSLIWCVTKSTLNDEWPENWPREDKDALAAYRKDGVTPPDGPDPWPVVPWIRSPCASIDPWTAEKHSGAG